MQEIIWSEQSSLPLLSLLLWLPALVLLGLLWTRDGARARRLALAGAAGELALAISLLVRFERGTPALQFVEYWGGRGGWPAYHLGVDGLSILFLPLTALLVLLLVGYIGLQPDGARRRKALIMVAGYESLLVGLFVSLDGLLFWMFAAAELLAAALLVGGLGTTRNRARAALHAGQFLGIGVVLLLSALVMLAWGHGQGESAWTFNMVAWRGADLSMLRQELVLGLLLIALAIRLPAFPFHVWLPTVAREGPVAIAVVLLGGMQVAVYALLRIGPVLPIAMHDYAWPVTWIALAGVLYAAVLAFMQLNLRSLLAFAVVSQNGAMLVALFSLTQSGFEGGLLLALNYGLALAGLLLIVGLMHRRAGTALLPRLAGKFDQAPLIGLFFLAAALGRIAMPGTPGFEAAHLALEGTLESRGWTITMLAGLSNVLAAGYLFWAYQRIFLVRTPKSKRLVPDLDVHERIVVGMLCAVMFGVGLYATPWIETITASTRELAAHVAQAPADIVVGRLDTGVVREKAAMENLALPPPLYAVDQVGFPLLSLMIFLPLLAGIVVGFVQDALIARRMGLIVCALEIALALLAVVEFDRALPSMQLMEDAAWIPSLNVRYQLGVDGISILFLPLTTLLFAAVLVASWASVRSMVGLHVGLLLVLQSVTLGVFCALDLVLFFVFWELTLVPVYFLITLWGIGPERRFAGMKYTLMMLAGGIPLLLGIVLLALNHATQVNQSIPDGLSFSYLALIATPLPARISEVVFALLFIGFAVKAPLFPFHTWLPKVAMEGPPGVSAILVGLKLGAFGILRFAIPLAPEAFREAAWLVGALGAVGVVYGGLLALNQTNLRRMLAFSSVSHVGLVMVGIAAMNVQGLHGAIYQTLNFAIISAGIFLAVGFVHHRLGSTDMASLGGVATAAPLLSAFFVLLGVASIGVPGTNGFVAENLLLVGAAKSHLGLAFATLLGIVLGAAYVLTFFRRALFGPVTHRAVAAMADLQVRERWVLAGGALLVLTGGLFPQTVLSVFAGAAEHWLARLG